MLYLQVRPRPGGPSRLAAAVCVESDKVRAICRDRQVGSPFVANAPTAEYESLEGAGEAAVEATTLIFDFDGEHLVVVVAGSIGSQRPSSLTSPATRHHLRGLRTPRPSSHWRRTRHASSHGHRLAHSVVTNEYAV